MELRLKKRIVGIAILLAMGLIIIPMFFGRSVNTDELKLSARIPNPPALPINLNTPIPPREATVPAITKEAVAPPASAPKNANMAEDIIFEELDSTGSTLPAVAAQASPTVAATSQASPPSPADSTAAALSPAPADAAAPAGAGVAVVPKAPSEAAAASGPTPSAWVASAAPAEPVAVSKGAAKPAKKPAKSAAAVAQNNNHTKTAKPTPVPDSWAVQLGSFSDKVNATNLMQKLQAAGFPAYIHSSHTRQGNFIRVLVGPQLHRSDADTIQKRLQREFSLKSIIVKVNS